MPLPCSDFHGGDCLPLCGGPSHRLRRPQDKSDSETVPDPNAAAHRDSDAKARRDGNTHGGACDKSDAGYSQPNANNCTQSDSYRDGKSYWQQEVSAAG